MLNAAYESASEPGVRETPRNVDVFGLWRGLSLGRIDSGSFLGTSESSLHEFSRSRHTKVARVDSYLKSR
jgi:hypothetical protein